MTRSLAILFDFPEEGWPSMDLAASMLLEAADRVGGPDLSVTRVCPPFLRVASRLAVTRHRRAAFNADRLLNRMWLYPRQAARVRNRFDLFHVADHSYAQLVHALPAERTGVYCHDLDTFRSLLEPEREPHSAWFRVVARRVLSGLRRAAIVFYSTSSVRGEIERHQLVDPTRLVHAPLGTAPEFRTAAGSEVPPRGLRSGGYLLNVGSCIPRKRIDVLLRVFAEVRAGLPELGLVQVGGTFSPEQCRLLERLGLADGVLQLPSISRSELAVFYRCAAAVLQPSEAEGFGLPMIEALACGAVVVASDIPVLREVGGEAALYCPVGDVASWTERIRLLLSGAAPAPPLSIRLDRAARYSWDAHARIVLDAYRSLLVSQARS